MSMTKSGNEIEIINHPPTLPELDDYTVEIEIPIFWRNMDAFGHVNNTVYLKFFEDVRFAYFWELGYDDPSTYRNFPKVFTESGVGPILSKTCCDFKQPLTFPDTVHIGARVLDIHGSRIEMDHLMISEELNGEVAEGEATMVTYNYSKKETVKVPKEVRARIEKFEEQSL